MFFGDTVYLMYDLHLERHLDPELVGELESLAKLTFAVYQNRQAQRALVAEERPIDFTDPRETFYSSLKRLLIEATGMQFIAVRERGQGSPAAERHLGCTLIHGWDAAEDEFTIPDYRVYEPFADAIDNAKPSFWVNRSSSRLSRVWRDYPLLGPVQSFAIFPIETGGRVSALLSLASSCHLDFTPTFESVTASVAQSVGSVMSNRALFIEKNELQENAIETTAALDAVEVFSDLAHQIRNQLIDVPELLELIQLRLKEKSVSVDQLETADEYVELIDVYDKMSHLLTQAEGVTEPPEMTLKTESVRKVWYDAVALVRYRLEKADIAEPKYDGPNLRIEIYPDQLRQVFFHLLTNSISAYRSRRSRAQARTITLHVRVPKDAPFAELRYVDHAGGINPSMLRVGRRSPGHTPLPTVEQAVFLRGVTSRPEGTGHGLWIVRQILDRHLGSIELVDYRRGVTFDITIPTDLRSRLRSKEM